MSDPISSADLQAFFFRAMVNGWANNPPKVALSGLPGFKAIIYEEGPLKMVDAYSKTPDSNCSGGITTIYVNDVPVWMMQYFGEYDPKVIPFLKEILLEAYRDNTFVGGRGVDGVIRQSRELNNHYLVYHNRPLATATGVTGFDDFLGTESVHMEGNRCLGYHRYQGGRL